MVKVFKLSDYNHIDNIDTATELINYSRLDPFFDMIPKFFYGKSRRVMGKYLESYKREFVAKIDGKSQWFTAAIRPAIISDKNGSDKHYFPAKREMLVETVLRRFATDGHGRLLDGQAGVVFSLYELRQELKHWGYTYSNAEIKTAINILTNACVDIIDQNGNRIDHYKYLVRSGFQEPYRVKGRSQGKCFVEFPSYVAHMIKNQSYRIFPYSDYMGFRDILTQEIFKRLMMRWTNAKRWNMPDSHRGKTYTVKLSTIFRDAGVPMSKGPAIKDKSGQVVLDQNNDPVTKHRCRDDHKRVCAALREICLADWIKPHFAMSVEKIFNGKCLVDVKYVIKPTNYIVNEIKKLNAVSSAAHK